MIYLLKKHAFVILSILLAVSTAFSIPAFCGDDSFDINEIDTIFFGDSRTVGLSICAGGCVYVGKVAAGYDWMAGEGYSLLQDMMSQYPDADIVFCFGVNDLGNVYSYIQFFRNFIETYKTRNAYFASVNPIADSLASANGYMVVNSSVEEFNRIVKEELPDYYLDTYTFLAAGGYDTMDGVHYGSETYEKIQNLTKLLVQAMKMQEEFETETSASEDGTAKH